MATNGELESIFGAVCGNGIEFSGRGILYVPGAFPWKQNYFVGTHGRTSTVSFVQAVSVIFPFVSCTATDPTDKTRFRKKQRAKSNGISNQLNMCLYFVTLSRGFFEGSRERFLGRSSRGSIWIH
ncbi:hypothetical protein L6164_010364 [Bauhinia variegata]|uniref:Uncharacterized protein n=1 Tax=Bauhinia variegata TaxID=167791 RepID=A0ACB9PMV2_BAUVA|nr:hypothetical protein L6164_010364 [Bauhinia variegata]